MRSKRKERETLTLEGSFGKKKDLSGERRTQERHGGGVNDQNFSIYKVVKEYLFIFKGQG